MTGLSSIDVAAGREVVRRLRGLVQDADDQRSQVGRACDEALCDTATLRGMSVPLLTIGSLASELEERIELAELIDAAGVTSLGGTGADGRVSWQVGDEDSIEDVRSQIAGLELAADLGAVEPGTRSLDRQDVELLGSCADRLDQCSDDPVAMAALFTALGPEGTLRVPVMLRDFAASYESGMVALSGQDQMWDEDTAMLTRIGSVQDDLIEAFGTGLATASGSSQLAATDPTFAADLAAKAAESSGIGSGWSLAQIMAHGVYDGDFLVEVGVGLVETEQAPGAVPWRDQVGGQADSWRLGASTAGTDPLVAVLAAMDRTPGAALDFFAPEHVEGATSEHEANAVTAAGARMDYLLGERIWPDDMAALGESLRAAAIEANTVQASVQDQQDSAWVASAMVHGFGKPGAQPIGEAAVADVAAVLAHYIPDVDDVGNGFDTAMSVGYRERASITSSWQLDLPVGAQLEHSTLTPVLTQLMGDAAATETLVASAGEFNARRIQLSVADWDAGQGDAAFLSGVNASAGLVGYLLGTSEAAGTSAGTSASERNQWIVNRLFDAGKYALDLSGPLTLATDPAIDALKSSVSGWVSGDAGAAETAAADQQERVLGDLKILVGLSVLDSPNLEDVARHQAAGVGQQGPLYPWFDPDSDFDFDALYDAHAQERVDFLEWLDRDAQGVPAFITDADVRFADGIQAGADS